MINMITDIFDSPLLDDLFVPPQLMKYWADILDSPIYVAREGTNQINFAIMQFSFGKFAVGMPYMGYGAWLSRPVPDLLREIEEFATGEDCLAFSFGTHPLAIQPNHAYPDYHAHQNFCQISLLDRHPFDCVGHHRKMAFQNELRKLPDQYFIDPDPSPEVFYQWLDVYRSLCAAQGATPYPDQFFWNYYVASKSQDVLFWVVRDTEEVLGGVFSAIGQGIADYGTSAFTPSSRPLCPTTYLLNALFSHLIDRGIDYFNWQSSKRRGDGTYAFKKRFGAEEYTHWYLSKPLVDLEEITCVPLKQVKKEAVGCYILPYEWWSV